MRMRSCSLALLLALAVGDAEAAPAPESGQQHSDHVIPPGREQPARELLDPVLQHTPTDLHWLGPTIEFDRIKWWLMRDDEALALLVLLPRAHAEPGEPTSHSFAIRVAWPPAREPEARERELLDAAVAAVQSRDHGQFYVVRFDLFENGELPPPYLAQPVEDPRAIKRRWALELFGTLLLATFALIVTLRRRPTADGPADA